MKYKIIVWSLAIGMLLGGFLPQAKAEEGTAEDGTTEEMRTFRGVLQQFYDHNPMLIESQQQKLKDILSFLDANGIMYYDYHDIEQAYVNVENQVYFYPPYPYEEFYNVPGSDEVIENTKMCVVAMSGRPKNPVLQHLTDDPIEFYVFGDLRGDISIDMPQAWVDIHDKVQDITGHTFSGTVKPFNQDRKYVKTSIAMDSFGIMSRANPTPSTSVYHAYVVPATAFRGKDDALFREFQEMIVQMDRLGEIEKKPKEDLYKKAVLGAYNAAVAETQKITNGSVFKQLDSIDAENKSLMSQLKEAQAQNNEALYIKAADIYNANNGKLRELIDTSDYKRFNRLAWFANSIKGMMNEGEWKEAHEFITSSGVAEEFGYQSPS